MDEDNKLPLKRVEFSLTKFNEVAIPHHLDLLRQHKANIIKWEEAGSWVQVRSEQTHAARVAAQLRALLGELEALRRRVAPADHARFDALTQRSRDLTLKAIVDYLETAPLRIARGGGGGADEAGAVCGSAVSTDSVGVVAHAEHELLQLQIDEQEASAQQRLAARRGWAELQREVQALHDTWRCVQHAARQQGAALGAAAAAVHAAGDNVQAGVVHLGAAERLRAGAYGAGGAALGALLGGPVGLLVGLKAGAAALVAGSALGYWGARVLGARRQLQIDAAPDTAAPETAAPDAAAPPDSTEKKTQ